MESQAQKKARANFKKAIAYRKKTGCSLKEAFAHVSGKKIVAKKTVVKKRSSSPLKKKKVVKKVGAIKKKSVKKPSEKNILNKIHIVKKDVEKLDKAQNKHMIGLSGYNKNNFDKLIQVSKDIDVLEFDLNYIKNRRKELVQKFGLIKYNNEVKRFKSLITELKKHKIELKKHI
jgi:hypothetical protein